MIYMEPEMLGWRPLLLSWLNTLPKTLKEDNKELIRDLFDRMETALLQFIRKGGFKVHTLDSWGQLSFLHHDLRYLKYFWHFLGIISYKRRESRLLSYEFDGDFDGRVPGWNRV